MVVSLPEVPPPFPGRPLFVNYMGGRVYVSAHDRYHVERLRQFKREIRKAHPDRNRLRWAAGRTRNLLKARERWQECEAVWYSQFGLEPPTRSRELYRAVVRGFELPEGKAA